jgi:uncharacterized protein (TIGR03382 family)
VSTIMSDPDRQALWQRIRNYAFDDSQAPFPFSARLARENDWTRDRTLRVLEEYRRFLFLAVTAGPCTPSVEVDQAWHLHLLYTRDYWDDLCVNVLRTPLHHGPTRGGIREEQKFGDLYERTLALYRTCFGQEPPPDLWPPSPVRFDPRHRTVQVTRVTHWIVRKPPFFRQHAAPLALLLVGGCAAAAMSAGTMAFMVILLIAASWLLGRRIVRAIRANTRPPYRHTGRPASVQTLNGAPRNRRSRRRDGQIPHDGSGGSEGEGLCRPLQGDDAPQSPPFGGSGKFGGGGAGGTWVDFPGSDASSSGGDSGCGSGCGGGCGGCG